MDFGRAGRSRDAELAQANRLSTCWPSAIRGVRGRSVGLGAIGGGRAGLPKSKRRAIASLAGDLRSRWRRKLTCAFDERLAFRAPIVELGPGTGPITEALIKRGIDPSRLVLVEFDGAFCRLLRKRFPGIRVVQGDAYALSAALDEHYLMAQITRLGRFSASERLIDWMLETQERLMLAGLADGNRLSVPLTQEFLADTLGLTSGHVNRTLQALRRENLLTIADGTIVLLDQQRLEKMVHFKPARAMREAEESLSA